MRGSSWLFLELIEIEVGFGQIEFKQILSTSEMQGAGQFLKPPPFLERAVSARVDCQAAGNLKHFPLGSRCKMSVLSPRQFIDEMTRRRTK